MRNKFFRYLVVPLFTLSFMGCGASDKPSSEQKTDKIETVEPSKIVVNANGYTGGLVQLIGTFSGQNYLIDSSSLDANGQVVFESEKAYQSGIGFVKFADNGFFPILIDKDQQFELTTVKGDLQNQMKVTGSLDNELYYDNVKYEKQYQNDFTDFTNQLNGLDPNSDAYTKVKEQQDLLVDKRIQYLDEIFKKHPNSFFTAFKRAGQNPKLLEFKKPNGTTDTVRQVYTYRTQFWDNVDFNDDRLLYTPVIGNKLKRYINVLTAQNPDSILNSASFLVDKVLDKKEYFKYFANWITLNYDPSKSTVMDADAVYAGMIKKYFTKERAFWSSEFEIEHLQRKASEMSTSLIGMKGPDVQAKDQHGNLKSIYEIKSPYIVIFMFSPTCDHCIEESPRMAQFYREWKNKGVEVFGIGVDTNQEEWAQFIKDKGLDVFTNVYDPTNKAIYKKYYVDVTPEIYVLNPDREIIGKNLDVSQIELIIERDKK